MWGNIVCCDIMQRVSINNNMDQIRNMLYFTKLNTTEAEYKSEEKIETKSGTNHVEFDNVRMTESRQTLNFRTCPCCCPDAHYLRLLEEL